ncbi:UdgX family uracil-DNA binding protein [Sorangium sp. So ce1128]
MSTAPGSHSGSAPRRSSACSRRARGRAPGSCDPRAHPSDIRGLPRRRPRAARPRGAARGRALGRRGGAGPGRPLRRSARSARRARSAGRSRGAGRSPSCQACALCERATQTVFGEGPADAALMLVGEQPGDEEDLCGRPFVGPAGRVLDEALAGAGLSRGGIYVTNAVKHFKWEPRGERRLHAKPVGPEIQACRAWLQAEVEAVRPRVIVCLGATAARSFLGGRFSVTQSRGQVFKTPWAEAWMATYHPAALLRMPDEASRAAAKAHLQADLAKAASLLAGEERRSG